MAQQEACSAVAACGPSASSEGVLPVEVLYDVLLHLPAKTLCRLRAVSRSWRSLLTAVPHFATAHASRHLYVIAVFFHNVDTFDLSGNRLRRVSLEESGSGSTTGLCTHGNLACLTRTGVCPNRVRLINIATGAVSVLPPAPDGVKHAAYMLGQVTSSGEYKLLCVAVDIGQEERDVHAHAFVLGLGAGGDKRWRRKESSPVLVASQINYAGKTAVVQGTAYCLATEYQNSDSMVSFDLETEEWAPAVLPGPLGDRKKWPSCFYGGISVAELSGCLVTAHTNDYDMSMDLWFLVEGQWSKRHHIRLGEIFDFHGPEHEVEYMYAEPLFVFDDGRILLCVKDVFGTKIGLRVYDTR